MIETLSTVDNRPMRPDFNGSDPETAVERPEPSGRLLNGPRLDGEAGTVSQRDIDAMFP